MWRQSHKRAVKSTYQVRHQMERAGYRRADAAERAQFAAEYVHRQHRKGGKGTDRVVLMNGMVVDRKELVHHVAIEACDDLITSGTPLPTPLTMPPSDEDEDDVDYVEVEASSEPSVPRQASPTMLRAASSSPTKQNRGRVSTLTHSLTHSLTHPLTRSLTCTLASG